MKEEQNLPQHKYQITLDRIRVCGITVEILLLIFRVYVIKVPSFLSLLQLSLVAMLCSATLTGENQIEAKLYILLNFIIVGFGLSKILESISEENSDSLHKILIDFLDLGETIIRMVLVLIGWRIYQFYQFRKLYPEFLSIGERKKIED